MQQCHCNTSELVRSPACSHQWWCEGCFQCACTQTSSMVRSTSFFAAVACSAGKAAVSPGPALKLTSDEATVLMSFRPRGRSSLKALNTPGRAKGRVECGSNPAVQAEQSQAWEEPPCSATATDACKPEPSPGQVQEVPCKLDNSEVVCSRSFLLPAGCRVLENDPK